jgi:flagellar assembly protein FliH
MGKIVKFAEFTGEKYLVGVPHFEAAVPAEHVRDSGDRFASPYRAAVTFDTDPFADIVASSALESQPQIDWNALKADADAIVDRAAADAEAMLHEAQIRAMELIDAAQARVMKIEADARDRGHDDGVAAGTASANAEMSAMMQTMRELIESARAERREIIESAEPELVRLALAIAERVVHQHIAVEPAVVVDNVRQALTRLVAREIVTVRLNPADLEVIREHRDAIVASTDVEHLRIVEDQRVDRGGVVIETESGTIDAKVATQLREARRAIAVDEPIVTASREDGVLSSSAQAS